jgi:glucan phosphoethanolaminetransferase (alkaline phosphatase superfamily)
MKSKTPEMVRKKILSWIALDVLVWTSFPSLFLLFYVYYQSAPVEAVWPHLRVVLLLLFSLAIVRFVLFKVIRNTSVAQVAAAIFSSFLFATLLLYYIVVSVGLRSWGQVISLSLLNSYVAQLDEICETIGISLALVASMLVFIYACFFLFTWLYIKRFNWPSLIASKISNFRFIGIVLFCTILCASEYYNFFMASASHHAEPFALTFFPAEATFSIQGHVVDKFSAEKLDKTEDAERLNYKISANSSRRNLILVVVDALRPDHLSIYGYERDTTPKLRLLEKSGMARKVKGVRSSCSESSCGLLSIAASKFVHQFSNRPFTLQQVLQLYGYKINMILGGDHTNFYGLKRLYGKVDSYFDGSEAHGYYKNDDQLVLDKVKSLPVWDGQPVMLQLHLMSAHILGKRHEKFTRYQPSVSYALPKYHTVEHIQQATNFYDNGVLQTDDVIANLLNTLKKKNYLENSLVVITGDHGEALGEHGVYAHAKNVYEEAIRIPLIFVSYGFILSEFHSSRLTSSQVDIAPTILKEFRMNYPKTWAGIPLQNADPRGYIYFQEGNEIGMIDHRDPLNLMKYWINVKSRQEYAFNLKSDAKEDFNLIDSISSAYLKDFRARMMQLRSVTHGPQ